MLMLVGPAFVGGGQSIAGKGIRAEGLPRDEDLPDKLEVPRWERDRAVGEDSTASE
ncbi:MAG: hypothetical protein AAF211_15500 [Myxococcota bacterium]